MAFYPWSDFFNLVTPSVPAASDPVVIDALRRSTREFCERTLAHKVDMDIINLREGRYLYDLSYSVETVVVQPVRVVLNSRFLHPIVYDDLPPSFEDEDNGAVTNYFMQLDGTIGFYKKPSKASLGKVYVKAALKPSIESSNVDSNFLNVYGEKIGFGALAHLFSMKSAPWYDADQYTYNRGKFNEAIGSASINSNSSYSSAQHRVKYNKW